MLSDEEKQSIESLKNIAIYIGDNYTFSQQGIRNLRENLRIVLPAIEKQSKEIEELKKKNKPQPDCAEPIERIEEMVNMRWVNHNYINKKESEQRERKAYIKGTNDAHELCNKKWEDKIKAKIEESELLIDNSQGCMSNEDLYKEFGKIEFGKSLLEKE